jgi:iron complex outermembrane receptor protein
VITTKTFRLGLLCSGAMCVAVPALAQTGTPNAAPSTGGNATEATQPAQASPGGLASGDIVVTARRRDEKLQDVPVSVTAFSPASLQRSTVQSIGDVGALTPGLTFSSEGGAGNTTLTLRGIGQIPLGEGTPGVVIYVNNEALPPDGSNVPAYDIASIQVLKGPQGTLFGKNTLGGAMLIATQAPVYKFGGYIEGDYGRYNYKEVQGAINIPIIQDKVAIRFAGQIRRQDPRTKSFDGGPGFDNIHQDAARISLLLTPFDGFKSTTVAEYYRQDELAGGLYLLRQNFPFGVFFGPAAGPVLDAQVQAELAEQHAHPRSSYDDGIDGGLQYTKSRSITNDTSYSFGPFTLRNIFGYRKIISANNINTGAVGGLTVPSEDLGLPAGENVPFTLFHASSTTNRQYLTNETQFLGNFGRLNFIAGFYYNDDKPNGPGGSQFSAFSFSGPAAAVTSQVENNNKAIYGQIGYKFTDKLTLNVGGRYSWDKVSACGGSVFADHYGTFAQCKAIAALNNPNDGVGDISNSSKQPSYTIDLDYKVTPNWLLYAEHRRGFRSANVNTPYFETWYTTCQGTPIPGGTCYDLRGLQKTGVEKLYDFEVGSKLSFNLGGARGHWNVAVYRDIYKGALQFFNTQTLITAPAGETVPDAPNRGSVGVNAANETIYGVETEISVSPTENFTVSFNGAYTHVNIDSLTVPAGLAFTKQQVNKFSPTFAGTLSASWTMPWHPLDGNVVLNGDLYMTAAYGGQDGEKLPGYNLANARIDWKGIAGTGLDLGLYVRNLTNEFYFAATSVELKTFPISSEYLGEPRTFGVSARYHF